MNPKQNKKLQKSNLPWITLSNYQETWRLTAKFITDEEKRSRGFSRFKIEFNIKCNTREIPLNIAIF